MLKLFLVTLLIVGICVVLLCVRILLKKNGRFPNMHVGSNKAMHDRGIGCNVSQDRQARQKSRTAIAERKQIKV